MNELLNNLPELFGIIFYIFYFILFHRSIKKCFWKGDKNRFKLALVTLLTNPMLVYFATLIISSFLIALLAFLVGLDKYVDGDSRQYIIMNIVINGIVYMLTTFLLADLVGKWLGVPNRSLVTFNNLMFSVLFALSLRSDISEDNNAPGLINAVELVGTLILFFAAALLYRLVIRALSKLTDKHQELNEKLFIIPPTIFCLFYIAFTFSSSDFIDTLSQILIYFFSTIILFLFIWSFYVIIENINATNEALAAKDMAAAAERLNADLSVAKAIQKSALPNVFPPFPERKEFELFAVMNPAKEVGGDFYDFYMLNDSTLGFIIADVSGKSISGAMFMMTSKTMIKSLAESGLSPAEVFTIANEKLCENNDAEMFVTAWLGYLDLKTGLIHVANAGHNPPVLIREGNAEYVALKPGLMLAGMNDITYTEQTLRLQKGDILYLYTDGVTEAMNEAEDQYGEDRLKKLLSFGTELPAPSGENGIVGAVCSAVSADISGFTEGAEQSDDITMLCIRFLGGE